MSDELVKRIQEKCAGRDRWYVMNAAEDGYCMDFDWGYDADRWMDDRLRENPDYIKRNGYHVVKKRSFTSAEELANEAAALIEQQAAQLLDARRTAEYWKAEHNAANARIAELEAQIATVAPAVDAQPVAIYQVQTGDCWLDMTKEQFDNHSKSRPTRILYASAQSEGLRKDAERSLWIENDLLRELLEQKCPDCGSPVRALSQHKGEKGD